MHVHGPKIVGRAVQMDPTLQHMLQKFKKCWDLFKRLTGFKLCTTTHNNMQQHATGCANRRNM